MVLKFVQIVFSVQRAILRGHLASIQKDIGDEIVIVRNLTFQVFYSHRR